MPLDRDDHRNDDALKNEAKNESFDFDREYQSVIDELDEVTSTASEASSNDDESMGETPEESMRRFASQRKARENTVNTPQKKKRAENKGKKAKKPFFLRVFGKGKRNADEDDYTEDVKQQARSRFVRFASVLRFITIALISLVLAGFLGLIGLSNFIDSSLLGIPESIVSRVITPLQSTFSWATEGIAGYLRQVKMITTLEEAYNNLRAENEQLVYQAMLSREYEKQLSQYEDIYDEINANRTMDPVTASVIGKFDGNYFSTFTINKGTRDGLDTFMAVTISGALIGYTEEVRESESTVRTIIDSESSIAALIQSSRDQGIIKGTLGVDGSALCRMYYLPDDNLPRPGDIVVTSGVGMSFPKGIPIGTVRESTRGMDSNKQYVVVEPAADFQHIEYVIVYRYKPRAEAIVGRENASSYIEYVPLETARPYPTLQLGSSAYFLSTATPAPTPVYQSYATLHPGALPEQTPEAATPTPKLQTATPTRAPTATPEYDGPVYEYQTPHIGPTPTPSPSPTPSPTPFVTFSPDDFTWEDE